MADGTARVLAGRYEIDSVLGEGGMAKVFRGTDKVLGRTVAVKVLAPHFAKDQQFVARFRREAQAAAALNHPNVVSVYDTGSEDGIHWIVMEYVDGRTLKDVIREEGRLLPERAVEIAQSVCMALASAHEKGLVHRDIKPGNIMLTPSGETKVMDFGIARATAGADTLTQTAAVLGTAAYLSPEQAQGKPVDARSDIYAVGCVLFEMLTAHPPFEGESPVAIAYKHVRETPTPPSRFNRDVPKELDAIVLKCLAKNPDNRYQTTREMAEDLHRLARGQPVTATPVLPGDPTEVVSRPMRETQIMRGVPPEEEEERRKVWPIALAAVLVLAALVALGFFLFQLLRPSEAALVEVPRVIGETRQEAEQELEQAGFVVRVERDFNADFARNLVFDQRPPGGTQAEQGSEVTIFVSKGEEQVTVPNLVGKSRQEAEQILSERDLEVGLVTERDDPAEPGTVLEQSPGAGERVDPGTPVNLIVSSGPGTVAVPNVVCDDLDTAEQEIEGRGLDMQVEDEEFSLQCPEGTVARQEPEAGTEVERGSTVRVWESLGPEPEPSPTDGD
ncbi:MAG TPA: Stk1 family PASTA domain-containing Ser/Thr kinase [Actinomycetota bacterium]|nr:Stk1 family PASTA domain-containing Ser/Thr kinase [Actinomycetota bacterium]